MNALADATMKIEFTLPGLPSTLNSRKHHMAIYRERKTWKQMVWAAVLNQKPVAPFQKAKVTLTRHSSRPMDGDNLASSFKAVLDGLVEAQVLRDDSFNTIGMPDFRWEKSKQGFITVRVEPV